MDLPDALVPDRDTQGIIELIGRRRSVAPIALVSPGPSRAETRQILALAARVPDHGKLVPWRFLVFDAEARLRAGAVIAATYREDHPDAKQVQVDLESQRLARAPLVIGVVSRASVHQKIPQWEQELSAGAVCMNLVLAANAMGYATSWLTEWYAYDRRVLAAFDVSPEERMAGFIHIGTATAVPEDRARPLLDQIVSYF